jgi:uncharacterized DUF497 family protein
MFSWDSANISHIAVHSISTEEVEQVIENSPVDLRQQLRNGEERTVHVGETANGRVLVVIATMRGELIRVVTAFPANKAMRKFYLAQKDLENAKNSIDT